ncbi:hypothetical protein R6Q59_003622 [Mikania micrantha]
MNISNLRESNHEKKQDEVNFDQSKSFKPNLTTSSWSKLKDPRIVRVSRAFGGKDRHSKVCTVRGLRDRRVRLSVPTAIQLYDLQDRLGLNQPSKAVDWLLEVAKNEIDELPPLQIPAGSFGENLQAMLNASSQERSMENAKRSSVNGLNWEDQWNPERCKPVTQKTNKDDDCEEHDHQDDRDHKNDHNGTFVQSCNFFERNPNPSNVPDLLHNVIPNSSFFKWDPSKLSQFGSYGSVTSHQHDDSTVHILYPPPSAQTQSYFHSHNHNSREFDSKQLNFQMVSSSSSSNFTPRLYTISQGMRPFDLSMNPKFFASEDDGHDHGLDK